MIFLYGVGTDPSSAGVARSWCSKSRAFSAALCRRGAGNVMGVLSSSRGMGDYFLCQTRIFLSRALAFLGPHPPGGHVVKNGQPLGARLLESIRAMNLGLEEHRSQRRNLRVEPTVHDP